MATGLSVLRDVVLQQHVPAVRGRSGGLQWSTSNYVLSHRAPSEPFEILFRERGGSSPIFSRVVAGPDSERSLGRIWVFEDVTEHSVRVARQLLHMAERDPLTNLYNRRRFHEELERMLADGCRHRECVGLLAIDLDGFKPVNRPLRPSGRRRGAGGSGQRVGLGGPAQRDVLTGWAERRVCDSRAVGFVHRDLGAGPAPVCVHRRVELQLRTSQSAGVTASIGIALSTRNGENAERLIGAADRAMYLAKSLGGNCWEFAREVVGEAVE